MGAAAMRSRRGVVALIVTGAALICGLLFYYYNAEHSLDSTPPPLDNTPPSYPQRKSKPISAANSNTTHRNANVVSEINAAEEIAKLRNELAESEKRRATLISRVDDAAISHIKYLIPPPNITEANIARERLKKILQGNQFDDASLSKICTEIEDYISCGISQDKKTPYNIRILTIDLKPGTNSQPIGYVTKAMKVDYGIDATTGVPWMKTFGNTATNTIPSSALPGRYGHLYAIGEFEN
jgi:hypothetical protein